MALPAFDANRHDNQRRRPRVRVLEVRKRTQPNSKPISLLFVKRQEVYSRAKDGRICGATIRLFYETIEPKNSFRSRTSGTFQASYSGHLEGGDGSISLVDGALFFDPRELRGQRIGTYLMNEIVAWAKQWPEATVRSIQLMAGQSEDENRERRNKFYEQFGLVFEYDDPEHNTGASMPMKAGALTEVTSWQANIREGDPREVVAELLAERNRLERELSQRDSVIKNLSTTVENASNYPVKWAARRLWWRHSNILLLCTVMLALTSFAWLMAR